ncbi:tannase/feruloyl esterase family alpha/beta hydrolase [Pusillimonas sp. CC-YST705]|uniref:Tannase/feruloyl esterase family alpha/beta hydrolase n=1 Tax=Mesopusillimonas faecipullorum TaxID=2755040 RepID=A0ABS8C8G2_9BURK|nr:tannase/feruloyl esterase family alpha/beta hydrolase [Mesopusillimonas faecipullorum]MCB5362307.1 tannase/feruloyl esterase family alpha/beta hydrolase [Mesopusillimonas faecipullorum]
MRKNKKSFRSLNLAGAALATALLAACGGGSSDDSASNPPNPAPEPGIGDLAIAPKNHCTMEGVGATALTTDDDPATGFKASILEVSQETVDGDVTKEYCLVKVHVDPEVNIHVAMPSDGTWNGRFRSEGGGMFAGAVSPATGSVGAGFVGVTTDTGHQAGPAGMMDGSFALLPNGQPNVQAKEDFAYRSLHLMSVVGKQLTQSYYEQEPVRSYWYGCSTGGRQGLAMAQRYPDDYDAILVGAPAIHMERFQSYQIWPSVVQKEELGLGNELGFVKGELAGAKAIAACDALDGVVDGVIDDPRLCNYQPSQDPTLTYAGCNGPDCLTHAEAIAIEKIWAGAKDINGNLLWPGQEPSSPLFAFTGANPFGMATEQAKYWVYYDPTWDWKTLTYENYGDFFQKSIDEVGPVVSTSDPDLSQFKARGGKLIMWHGWTDFGIQPQGTIRYYESIQQTMGKEATAEFVNLYMAPGVGHCNGGDGPNLFGQAADQESAAEQTAKNNMFRALMDWSEKGVQPAEIIATKQAEDQSVTRTRPLCTYPLVARHTGNGSTDDAANFTCETPTH